MVQKIKIQMGKEVIIMLSRLMIAGAIIASLMLVGLAQAEPFLVCDPQENVDSYVLSVNGGEEVQTPYPLHYDLGPLNLSDGNNSLIVRAKNVWGESASVPFDFTKGLSGSPQGVGLSSE